MKFSVNVIFCSFLIASCVPAFAQSASAPSTDVIMQRLDALDKRNEALDKRNAKLERENAELRNRMQLLEGGKRKATVEVLTPSAQPKGPASAMAMMPRSYAKAPNTAAVAAPYNWTGFYVGVSAGGAISDQQWSNPTLDSPYLGSHKATGWLGGVQGGYNWQTGQFVLGVEGTYHFADLRGDHQATIAGAFGDNVIYANITSGSDRFSTKINGIATVAGRVGFASDSIDRTLLYAKGGVAYVNESFSQITNGGALIFGGGNLPQAFNFTGIRTGSDNRWGWMAGLGLEHGLTENWSAKIEYDYLDFGTRSVRLSGIVCIAAACGPATSNNDLRQNAQLLTLGINYRFNNNAVVAKY